jgi:hypothetical protein
MKTMEIINHLKTWTIYNTKSKDEDYYIIYTQFGNERQADKLYYLMVRERRGDDGLWNWSWGRSDYNDYEQDYEQWIPVNNPPINLLRMFVKAALDE